MKLALLTRVALALASASVTSAILVFVSVLSETAPTPPEQQVAGQAGKPVAMTSTSPRMGRTTDPKAAQRPA